MSESLTAAQAHERTLAAMGTALGEVFSPLSDELTFLHWRWGQFVALYATKPERLELMNRSAPFFFSLTQGMFWEDALMGIARLAGPPRSAGHDNLSIQRIPALLTHQVRVDVERLVDVMREKASFAIEWRNRRIAHRDLALALDRPAQPLPDASRRQVDEAHESMAAVLNAVSKHFLNTTTIYNWASTAHGAESLLFVIRDGLRREEIRQERIERGDYRDEDWDDRAPAV